MFRIVAECGGLEVGAWKSPFEVFVKCLNIPNGVSRDFPAFLQANNGRARQSLPHRARSYCVKLGIC
jgi:hypothetical protein